MVNLGVPGHKMSNAELASVQSPYRALATMDLPKPKKDGFLKWHPPAAGHICQTPTSHADKWWKYCLRIITLTITYRLQNNDLWRCPVCGAIYVSRSNRDIHGIAFYKNCSHNCQVHCDYWGISHIGAWKDAGGTE